MQHFVVLGARAPQFIESEMTSGADGAARININKISIFGAVIRTKVENVDAFGSEFEVVGFFEESLGGAAPNSKIRNVGTVAGELLKRSKITSSVYIQPYVKHCW